MLMIFGHEPNGYKVIEYKDIVIGIGNSSSDGKAYREAAFKNLAEAAAAHGANAVINIHFEISNILGSTVEATAYGNAVVLEALKESSNPSSRQKIDYNKFISANMGKEETDAAKIIDINGYKFVVCPKCGSKYKADIDKNGKIHIKGFDDVDDKEPGLQVFCIRCGSKFTVPENI